MLCATDVMSAPPVVVDLFTPPAAAARLLLRHGVRHLPVVDADGRLCGVLQDGALFSVGELVGARDELWVMFEDVQERRLVRDLMEPTRVSVAKHTPFLVVLDRLLASRSDYAIVLDKDGQPVGIITEHDAIRYLGPMIPPSAVVDSGGSPLFTVPPNTPAPEALDLMNRERIRHLLMVEEGRVTGVLSRRDLIRQGAAGDCSLDVEHVVREETFYAAVLGTPLRAIASEMLGRKYGCAPVVDTGGRPVGIVTRTDLIALGREMMDAH